MAPLMEFDSPLHPIGEKCYGSIRALEARGLGSTPGSPTNRGASRLPRAAGGIQTPAPLGRKRPKVAGEKSLDELRNGVSDNRTKQGPWMTYIRHKDFVVNTTYRHVTEERFMSFVPADGPVPCDTVVVGEAPAREEVRLGKGFVGPSGKLLWPLMIRLANKNRAQCRVTNLSHYPLDNDVSGDAKMTDEQFKQCSLYLWGELCSYQPKRILAVGSLAAKALLGDRFTNMRACNGSPFSIQRLRCLG